MSKWSSVSTSCVQREHIRPYHSIHAGKVGWMSNIDRAAPTNQRSGLFLSLYLPKLTTNKEGRPRKRARYADAEENSPETVHFQMTLFGGSVRVKSTRRSQILIYCKITWTVLIPITSRTHALSRRTVRERLTLSVIVLATEWSNHQASYPTKTEPSCHLSPRPRWRQQRNSPPQSRW